ncbi:hypothetical protein EI541_09920 [Xanthomonas citri pv. eucalyptorum]|nr:hypothetical protein EI541_09920 [Xanthomonas axonopodis pv. eucalyptorum]
MEGRQEVVKNFFSDSKLAHFWLFFTRIPADPPVGWPVLSLGLALLVVAGTATDSALGRLRVPGAAWLAAISYSVYLTHKAMFHVTQGWFGATLDGGGVPAFAVYGVVALAAGALLHYMVERPFLQLRGALLRWRAAVRRDAELA